MNWLIGFRVKTKELTLFHHISIAQEQLCAGLATDRIYLY